MFLSLSPCHPIVAPFVRQMFDMKDEHVVSLWSEAKAALRELRASQIYSACGAEVLNGFTVHCSPLFGGRQRKKPSGGGIPKGFRGADGSRNHDLFDANEALYQLSYSPLGVVLLRRTTQFTVVRPPPKCKTASQCTCVECVSDGEYQRRSIGACVSKCIPPPHSHYRNTICWLSSRRSCRQSGRYARMRR